MSSVLILKYVDLNVETMWETVMNKLELDKK
jgi:uncharacterized protein with HEPN domain